MSALWDELVRRGEAWRKDVPATISPSGWVLAVHPTNPLPPTHIASSYRQTGWRDPKPLTNDHPLVVHHLAQVAERAIAEQYELEHLSEILTHIAAEAMPVPALAEALIRYGVRPDPANAALWVRGMVPELHTELPEDHLW